MGKLGHGEEQVLSQIDRICKTHNGENKMFLGLNLMNYKWVSKKPLP